MAGFQEEDFSSASDKCSERDAHADWLHRESTKVMVLPGIVWVQESKKAAFSLVFIQSLVPKSFYITLHGILICLECYCCVRQGAINTNDADVQSE